MPAPALRPAALATLLLLSALAPAQDPPPPAPEGGGKEVAWPLPGGPLPEPTPNRKNTPERAVDAALDWLLRHQSKEGSFDPASFDAACRERRCPGAGNPRYAVGLTGLATLALLRGGRLPGPDGEGARVAAALRFLEGAQGEDGAIGPKDFGHHVYNHAVATLALCEAAAATAEPRVRMAARRGLDWIRAAQTPYRAWRYGVRPEENDVSVTGWMVQALRAGTRAGMEVEPRVFEGAVAFLEKARNPETGRTGYRNPSDLPARPGDALSRFPPALSESMTASALLTRLLCGADGKDPRVAEAAALCLARLPEWDTGKGSIDLYYWFYGTESFAWLGREGWKKWSRALEGALLPWQRGDGDGCARGSWDPVDPWQGDGGRIYATALGALMARRLGEKR